MICSAKQKFLEYLPENSSVRFVFELSRIFRNKIVRFQCSVHDLKFAVKLFRQIKSIAAWFCSTIVSTSTWIRRSRFRESKNVIKLKFVLSILKSSAILWILTTKIIREATDYERFAQSENVDMTHIHNKNGIIV